MSSTTDVAALDECLAPLNDEERRELLAYWDQVIREELREVVPVRRVPRAVPSDYEVRRERREARRVIARIAAAGRRVQGVPEHFCGVCGSAIIGGQCSNPCCPSYVDAGHAVAGHGVAA